MKVPRNIVGDILNELKPCRNVEQARRIHAKATKCGCDSNAHVFAAIMKAYARSGSMLNARQMFESVPKPSLLSWNTLLLGYVANGEGKTALEMFHRLKSVSGHSPDPFTYVAALKACTSLAANEGRGQALKRGREIHAEIGSHPDIRVQSTLIDMYCKLGSMADAKRVFDSVKNPDLVSWTVLLYGYAENGEERVALELFAKMKDLPECAPDSFAYIAALKACTSLAASDEQREDALKRGREIHSELALQTTLSLQNTLIDMYSTCRSMAEARRVFDAIQNPDVVSWTALLLGYAENGEGQIALDLFTEMSRSVRPNAVTYVAALKACTSLAASGEKDAALQRGKQIHLQTGRHLNAYVLSALIDMYAKCGNMEEAQLAFDAFHNPDVVCWSALLSGYAENGEGAIALELFARMKQTPGCVPNAVTYIAALRACGQTGDLALGRELHAEMKVFTPRVVTCLVDLYARCGSMTEACEAYDSEPRAREISTVNALLAGFGRFGDCGVVLNLFEALEATGLQPDAISFVCVLSCCSHAGLIEKARGYFSLMALHYGMRPDVSHYNCMVDVLGRSNQLDEAVELVQGMRCDADAVTWMTLLSAACRNGKKKNAEIGRWAFQALVDMDRKHSPAHVLMSHIYDGSEQG